MPDCSNKEPLPFVQPFLELTLVGDGRKRLSDEGTMFIDVGGKIDAYIQADNTPTALLIRLCDKIAKAGAVVSTYQRYTGSGGASHILRRGVLFRRVGEVETPGEHILAYEYRAPVYRGL